MKAWAVLALNNSEVAGAYDRAHFDMWNDILMQEASEQQTEAELDIIAKDIVLPPDFRTFGRCTRPGSWGPPAGPEP